MRWWWLLVWVAAAQTPDVKSPAEAMQAALDQQRAAATRQRRSVQKQLESAAHFRWGPLSLAASSAPALPDAPCPPVDDAVAAPLLESAAKAQDLPVRLLRAVIEQESGFKPCAVSSKGAKGLMQLMPATLDQFAVADPFDPRQNIDAGARFLKQLMGRYNGDVALALGAYNAGPGNVTEAAGLPAFPETRNYVESILRKLDATQRPPPISPVPPVSMADRPAAP